MPRGGILRPCSEISFKSAPAQNALSPAPVNMAMRNAGSLSKRFQAGRRLSHTSLLSAFRCSGRSMVRIAIASSRTSKRTASPISESPSADFRRAAVQLFAELRMRNGDETTGALGERPPLELGHAELGDDHVDVRARGGNRAADSRYDTADRPAFGRRRQCDDRMPARGTRTGPDEIPLPAGPAQIGRTARLG